MAAPILQFKKGTTTPGNIFYAAEPAYDTTAKILYLGDSGGTGGGAGTAVASASATSAATAILRETAAGTSAGIILLEETGSGTDSVTIQVPALAASYTLTLPANDGDAGQVLQTNGTGGLTWVNQTSGYSGWSISDGSTTEEILSGNTVNVTGSTGIDATVSATDTLTIAIDSTVTTNDGTQTLTNKTLTSPVLTTPQINDSAADHQYIFASGDLAADRTVTLPVLTDNDTFVFESHTQTLSNKTLDGAISTGGGITYNGSTSGTTVLAASAVAGTTTLTLPAATDTLVGKATTDTFTNKTFDANGTGNSLSNVEVDNFAAAAIVTEAEGLASSDNDTSLPTTAAVKDYVDTSVGNVDVETGLSDGTTTSTVTTSQTLTIQGTTSEVEVGLADQTFTVGLPDNVTVTGTLAVNGTTLSTDETTFNLLDTTAQTINFGGAATTIDIGATNTGTTTVKNNLVVDGNLTVSGATTTVNTNNLLVEDRVIELGLVDGAAPTANTTWDTAIAFNYHTDSSAKKSALVWLDNIALVAAATITESSGTGNADPSIAVDSFANFAVGALYIGNPSTATNQVIDASKNVVNVIIDCGTYPS
jgi:hypothetical protein